MRVEARAAFALLIGFVIGCSRGERAADPTSSCESCPSRPAATVAAGTTPPRAASGSTAGTGSVDAGLVADGAAADGAAAVDCGAPGLAPLRACRLAAWPALAATTAADVTADSGATTAPVPGKPAGVVLSPEGAWVIAAVSTGRASGVLSVYQRTGAELAHDHDVVLPPGNPFGLTISGDGQTLAVGLADQIALFDVAKVEADESDALIATVSTHAARKVTVDLAFSRDDHYLFASLEYDDAVAVIDARAQTYLGAVPIQGSGVTGLAMSPDGTRLYAVSEIAAEWKAQNPAQPARDQVVGSVTVIDVARAETAPSTAEIGHVFVGRAPVRIALTADGGTAWVTTRGSNALVAFDTTKMFSDADHSLLATVAVGPAPVGLALLDHGASVLVANSNRFDAPQERQTAMLVSTARALAGTAQPVLAEVRVGAFPRNVVADESSAFLSNYGSGTLSGFDPSNLPPP